MGIQYRKSESGGDVVARYFSTGDKFLTGYMNKVIYPRRGNSPVLLHESLTRVKLIQSVKAIDKFTLCTTTTTTYIHISRTVSDSLATRPHCHTVDLQSHIDACIDYDTSHDSFPSCLLCLA